MRQARRAVLALVALGALAAPPAAANCNLIPGATDDFRGALGSLDQPFASPGDRVEVKVDPADPQRCDAASPGLLANAADHLVTIVFTPPAGPASAILLSGDAQVPPAALASCQAVLGASRVFAVAAQPLLLSPDGKRLAFPFPDSDAFALPADDLRGLTGAARIAVTSELVAPPCGLATQRCADTPGLLACIDELYDGDGTCETGASHRRATFSSFTALPTPNNFQALCDTPGTPCEDRSEERAGLANAIRFATDAAGNVLWPVNFEGVRVGGAVPIPRLVSGVTNIGAFDSAGAPVRIPGEDFLGSYSPDGGRLPPVFNPFADPDGDAALFGSVDAPRGVIRIARRSPAFGECSGGSADGTPCTEDAHCPAGSCGGASCRFACVGGSQAGEACSANADCPGGLCGSGQPEPLVCAADAQCPSGGECGPSLFDFRGREENLVGPVVIPDARFDLAASNPVPLDGLVETGSLFLEVRSEPGEETDLNGDGDQDDTAVVTIRDRSTGAPFPIGVDDGSCGPGPCLGRAVPRVRRLPYTFPAAAAEGDLVAFLEAEQLQGDACGQPGDCDANGDGDDADTLLRVYRNGVGPVAGDPSAPISQQIAVSTEPLVGGRPLALSDGIAFYRRAEVSSAPYLTTTMPPAVPGFLGLVEPLEISPDGRFVLFVTNVATLAPANLPGGDTNGQWDAFVYDRDSDRDGILEEAGATSLAIVSLSTAGSQGNGRTFGLEEGPPAPIPPGMSADGRFVVFRSDSTNLAGGAGGIFVRDRDADGDGLQDEAGGASTTTRIAEGRYPSISDDGRYVAFLTSQALAPGDTNGLQDAYVYDRQDQRFLQIGRGPGGTQLDGETRHVVIAAGGGWVAIQTSATNVAGAPAVFGGVYAVDLASTRHAPVSVTTRGQVGAANLTAISADGRFVSMTSFDYLGGTPAGLAAYVHDRDTDGDGALDEPGAAATIQVGRGFGLATARVADDGRFLGVGGSTAQFAPSTLSRLFEDVRTGLTQLFPTSIAAGNGAGPDYVVEVLAAAKGKSAVLPPPQIELVNGLFPATRLRTVDTTAFAHDANADGDLDDTLLYALDTNAQSPAPALLGPAGQVEVAAGRAAFLAPENGDLDGSPAGRVKLYRAGSVEDLERSAARLALADDWLAALVETGDPRGALLHVHPVSAPGGWVDLDLPADQFDVAGDFVAFLVPESAVNQSLNGDADTADRVLHLYDARDQTLYATGFAALDFVLGEALLAFRVPESGQGNAILNDDGDALDAVLHVIDLAAPAEPPIDTRQAAIACPFEACDGRFPYRIEGDTITFLTREEDQGGSATAPECAEVDPPAGAGDCDLNGDGDPSGVVLQHFNAVSAMLQAGAGPATSQFAATPAGVCTDSFESCLGDAQCASGTCFVAPGLCLRDTGSGCNPTVSGSCPSGQFCRPATAGPHRCHEIGPVCEALDSCTGGFTCESVDQDLQRLVGPVAPSGDAGAQLFAGAGRCLLDQGSSCLADEDCAVDAFCSDDERCVVQTGTCDATGDCTAPATCRRELVSAGEFDADGDGVADSIDDCPDHANVDQADVDADGIGDRCDLESCGDGVQSYRETCDDGNELAGDGCSPSCALEDATPACGNGRDDDGDGAVDFPADGGCTAVGDTSERREPNDVAGPRVCDDGNDNDGDLLVDWPLDPGCLAPSAPREDPACSNGVDDDGDGLLDDADGGCGDASDGSEAPDCADGIDNDGDAQIDFPADPQCAGANGPSESRRCANGLDDDADGAADFPADPGCTSATDDDERSVLVACDDGIDGDGDGAVDYPADPGCASLADPSERDPALACDDGLDGDGDGAADHPADPGCAALDDPDERSSALPCDDGLDHDGDALVDLADADCTSGLDPTEWHLEPGDVIVADNAGDRLLRVRPSDGVATVLFAGAPLLFPIGVEIDGNGDVVVYDFDRDSLYRLDLATGALQPLSLLGLFGEPRDAAYDPAGRFVFADAARDGVFRVDAESGAQQLVYSSTAALSSATSVAVEATGAILAADFDDDTVLRIPAGGGSATIVSSGQNLSLPRALVIEPATGHALVVDSGTDRLVRIDPAGNPTANQTVESQAQQFSTPWGVGIAADASGDVFVADNVGRLIRVDMDLPASGNQTLVASGLGELRGLAVVPRTQCSDGADGDGDGLVDLADPDCSSALDRTEFQLVRGDAVVSVSGSTGVRDGALVRVRAADGAQTRLGADGRFFDLEGIELDPAGRILVVDAEVDALLRFDPITGRTTTVSRGGLLVAPHGLAVDPSGAIVVSDDANGVVGIDPASGAQERLTGVGALAAARGVVFEESGDLLVTAEDPGSLKRVSLPGGAIASLFFQLWMPSLAERNPSGGVFVTQQQDPFAFCWTPPFCPTVLLLSPTGVPLYQNQTQLALEAGDVAIEPDGRLLVTTRSLNGIVRIDYPGFLETQLSAGGVLDQPFGIAIVRAGCEDGLDGDGDGTADFPADPGCTSALDADERDAAVACDDGVDNDGDALVDFPADPGCAGPSGGSELDAAACANGLDDDGDGAADFPTDPGCASASDLDERAPTLPCDDGVDGDGDGLADFPADPGCASAFAIEENPQCNDGLDNDGAPGIDYDGGALLDGDGDGFIDAISNPSMPAVGIPDPQCLTASRDLEKKKGCGLGGELVLLYALARAFRAQGRSGASGDRSATLSRGARSPCR